MAFQQLLQDDIYEAEEVLYKTIKGLKKYDYKNDLQRIEEEKDEGYNFDEFFNGFIEVYSSIFYVNEEHMLGDDEEFMNDLCILISHLKFIKYRIRKKQKQSKEYETGHKMGVNVLSPLIYYHQFIFSENE